LEVPVAPENLDDRKERIHCSQCAGPTWHSVLVERTQTDAEDIGDGISVESVTRWTTLECRGCESVRLRRSYWFSEWGRDALWQDEYFPPSVSRRPPRWFEDLNEADRGLMSEVYAALHAGSRRLTLMGARAMVDVIMQRQVGDLGGFERQLSALEDAGLITSRERRVLDAAVDAGSAAAHRGHLPTMEDAEIVLDIVENMLQAERLTPAAEGLRERTPARQRQRRPIRGNNTEAPGSSADGPAPDHAAPGAPQSEGGRT
jgi:hypothetical protein